MYAKARMVKHCDSLGITESPKPCSFVPQPPSERKGTRREQEELWLHTWPGWNDACKWLESFYAIAGSQHPRRTSLSSYVLNDSIKRFLCYRIWNNTNVWGLVTSYKLIKPMKALPRYNFSEVLAIGYEYHLIHPRLRTESNLHFFHWTPTTNQALETVVNAALRAALKNKWGGDE